MSKIKFVKKHDYWRILLTELFPYEVPLVFHLEGWKRFYAKTHNCFKNKGDYHVPFNYEIKKGMDEFRVLSLIHPLQCDEFEEFYKEYATYIIYLCNKQTKISLRYPTKITSVYYSEVARHYSGEVLEIDESEDELIEYVKFFSYRKFDGIYKFFESTDYQRLEKKYTHCFSCDISKCFYSIYTHTISWAVKGQEIAKAYINIKESFDSKFDKLMQKANFNETHGIIVGPEISRLFAEIILQKIDSNIIEDLCKEGYIIDRDYSIRRYVDDYYMYYNEENVFLSIYRILQKRLLEYKLSINESKSQHLRDPFIANNTIAKTLLSIIISENLGIDKLDTIKFHDAQRIITQIKVIVSTHAVSYSSIVNYLLAALDNIIIIHIRKIKKLESISSENLYLTLEAIFSIYFFLYSMDIRVDTSYKLSKRILETINILSKIEGFIDNFIQFIVKELEQCFDRIRNIIATKIVSIESINYIYTFLAIQNFCKSRGKNIKFDYYFNRLFFYEKYNCVTKEYFASLNYFELVVFIHCFNKDDNKMALLRSYLFEYFKSKKINENAESFYLFVDIQSCPYDCFDNIFKKKIYTMGFDKISDMNFEDFSRELSETKCSFSEWEISLENMLTRLLTKKAMFSYDKL
jgi:hypothetical protein